ncbi:isochorismatase family protein [Streptomyces cremeus]|uniref:Isochorismatase family protein n=1 Tax=Streptomyces cremeus TaxID=66881 RepID=A0ABV5PEG0_STRCM
MPRSAQRTARRLPGRPAGRGVDSVLITGTPTDVCGESSARDAATSGLHVLRDADANTARRDLDHNYNSALHTVHRSFGYVRTTAEVLALTGHGDAPEQGAAVRVASSRPAGAGNRIRRTAARSARYGTDTRALAVEVRR